MHWLGHDIGIIREVGRNSYITDVKNISLIQLLEQIAKQQYEVRAQADNQVKVQPKTSEPYRIIINALA
jgi:hypothetical protein